MLIMFLTVHKALQKIPGSHKGTVYRKENNETGVPTTRYLLGVVYQFSFWFFFFAFFFSTVNIISMYHINIYLSGGVLTLKSNLRSHLFLFKKHAFCAFVAREGATGTKRHTSSIYWLCNKDNQ